MDTDRLIRMAEMGMDGRHPTCDFPITNGIEHAVGYALLALVDQQQRTNAQLAGIAISLDRIANTLAKPSPAPEPAPEPQRRRWLPSRRNA